MDDKVLEILRSVSKKTGSMVAEERVKDEEYCAARSAAYMLFSEMWEELEEGEIEWKEAVEDLRKNLLAIDMPKPPEAEEEEKEEASEGEAE